MIACAKTQRPTQVCQSDEYRSEAVAALGLFPITGNSVCQRKSECLAVISKGFVVGPVPQAFKDSYAMVGNYELELVAAGAESGYAGGGRPGMLVDVADHFHERRSELRGDASVEAPCGRRLLRRETKSNPWCVILRPALACPEKTHGASVAANPLLPPDAQGLLQRSRAPKVKPCCLVRPRQQSACAELP